MPITIAQAVARLLEVVKDLHAAYPDKQFTLDGRLVGDRGEIPVAEAYDCSRASGHDTSSDRNEVSLGW